MRISVLTAGNNSAVHAVDAGHCRGNAILEVSGQLTHVRALFHAGVLRIGVVIRSPRHARVRGFWRCRGAQSESLELSVRTWRDVSQMVANMRREELRLQVELDVLSELLLVDRVV